MTKTISKDTIKRLIKDIKDNKKANLEESGIYYKHSEDDILKGYAMIVGPEDTPYFGGFYMFEIKFNTDYPYTPPILTYCTNDNGVRFNPNLYTCGKVCLSILGTWHGPDQWDACQNINTILLSILTILNNTPLLNEPGVQINNPYISSYNEIIEYANIDIAFCNILMCKYLHKQSFFALFQNEMKEHYEKNFLKLYKFVQNKLECFPTPYSSKVTFYRMQIIINYINLLEKMNLLKNHMDNTITPPILKSNDEKPSLSLETPPKIEVSNDNLYKT